MDLLFFLLRFLLSINNIKCFGHPSRTNPGSGEALPKHEPPLCNQSNGQKSSAPSPKYAFFIYHTWAAIRGRLPYYQQIAILIANDVRFRWTGILGNFLHTFPGIFNVTLASEVSKSQGEIFEDYLNECANLWQTQLRIRYLRMRIFLKYIYVTHNPINNSSKYGN